MSSNRLSTFGQRLQSLSDSFYSTILQDCKEDKAPFRNAQQLKHLPKPDDADFTIDQLKVRARALHSSTPRSIVEETNRGHSRRRRTTAKFISSSTGADQLLPSGHVSTSVSFSCHFLVSRTDQRLFHADESHSHEETVNVLSLQIKSHFDE